MSIRHELKVLIGRIGHVAMPHHARDIDAGRNRDRGGFLKRAMIEARIVDARRRGNDDALATGFRRYWTSAAAHDYHRSYLDERQRLFQTHHAEIVGQLTGLIDRHPEAFSRLVEIGCGDGRLLNRFAAKLPAIGRLVGVDLNSEVIAANLKAPGGDPRIDYVCADALGWLRDNRQSGTALFSYNGVLEYFSPAQFDALLAETSANGPAAIALVEPIAPEHDLDRMPESFAFGHESTFSHNHRHRLGKAGFDIAFERVLVADNIRWMMMVGSAGLGAFAAMEEYPASRRRQGSEKLIA